MPGVPRELAKHRIDVNEGSKPIKQRLRRFLPDKKEVIKKEITKLMAAEFMDVQTHSPVAFGLCTRNEIEVVVRIELQKDHDS
jgi:hypothetical protein